MIVYYYILSAILWCWSAYLLCAPGPLALQGEDHPHCLADEASGGRYLALEGVSFVPGLSVVSGSHLYGWKKNFENLYLN